MLLLPHLAIDVRIAALVGMAAMFAGASRALLASVVFAFETTRQPIGLLPLLGGCTAAFLVSCLLMRNTIMTEKIARRGIKVLGEYAADHLAQLRVSEVALRPVITLRADDTVAVVRAFVASQAAGSHHQGFPVITESGVIVGVLTRRDLLGGHAPEVRLVDLISRPPAVIYDDCSLRDAADHMARHAVGRLPVISRVRPHTLVGIITRSDLIGAHTDRLDEQTVESTLRLGQRA